MLPWVLLWFLSAISGDLWFQLLRRGWRKLLAEASAVGPVVGSASWDWTHPFNGYLQLPTPSCCSYASSNKAAAGRYALQSSPISGHRSVGETGDFPSHPSNIQRLIKSSRIRSDGILLPPQACRLKPNASCWMGES